MTANPRNRQQQIQNFLKQNNLKAWIAWRPDELLMLSGHFPYWGASLLVCFLEKEPLLFLPLLEPRDHIPAGLRVQEYPWGDLKCADPYSELVSAVAGELKKSGIAPEHVGMNSSSARNSLPIQAGEQIPIPENFSAKLASLTSKPEAKYQSAFANLYLKKDPDEIGEIRMANLVANIGLQAFVENSKPGVAEAEIAAAVESAIHRRIGHDGVFHSRGWAMVQSGPNSADSGRFNRSTGRRLEEGDLVLIELATCVNGYWSDLTRTIAVGSLKPPVAELLSLAQDAQQAAIDAIRPGVSAGEIDALARDKIAAKGFSKFFTHHTGHHVGFRYHDPGFLIFPGEPSLLEPGMVVTIEPGIYVPERGGGARIEENILVTESGHDVLSQTEMSPS